LISCLIIKLSEGDERFVLRRRSKNPNIPLGRTTRESIRQHSRGTLHIDDEPAVEIQEENCGSGGGGDTSSDDGEESDENYQISSGMKRSRRFMRDSSSGGHGANSGNGSGQHGEHEEEDENVQSGQPIFVTGVVMRKYSAPHDYVKVDYMKWGMTVKARSEREKNSFNVRKGRNIEYRFQTKFHQDFYESAILSKKYKVARDW
jgi:hypothetical protein